MKLRRQILAISNWRLAFSSWLLARRNPAISVKPSPRLKPKAHLTQLFLLSLSITAIASSPLLPSQAQNANTSLTIRADVQEANSLTGVVTATGNVKMTYPARQIDAVAEQAQYFSKEQRVVLTGNVVVTQEGVNSIKAQTITYLVSEGRFVAAPQTNQQVETIYVVPDRDLASSPATSATPVEQIKPSFKKQRISPITPQPPSN
ncbi:OstA family protein [Pseudanabaena sp. FACHB-1277]|uniref:OstA family protein n=1 Tax=Pseudanabaena cinerea FACHB-1277 TaxID=2949581 RepID=A0A926UUR9_9CYAN|nr:LptA/OstA family protein [Pseudanabaena cinerea]MBD2150342.1 OstA family protein [Pseudanabaena cinerea FACHB-1277]